MKLLRKLGARLVGTINSPRARTILMPVGTFLAGALLAYWTFYLQYGQPRRERIANALADFYSSGASAYYSAKEVAAARDGVRVGVAFSDLYQIDDRHYEEFLAASTKLAAEMPPEMRDEIFRAERLWDETEGFSSSTEAEWFGMLDEIRSNVLGSISHSHVLDPFWK